MPPPYNYCNKPLCRIRGESDMGYFVTSDGDPAKVILGTTAVYAAQSCGFTDDEIVYYCLRQGKRFGPGARSILNCSSDRPSSCSPSTYMPRASVTIRSSKTVIINDGSDFANLSWEIYGHYNTISLSDVGTVQCSSSRTVRPTTTTAYTLTVCNNGGCSSRSVTVTVLEPIPTIDYFTVSPSSIVQGESSKISWSVSGTVSSVSISTIGPVSSTGSLTVSPTDDVTYVLTATGPGGSTTNNATLVVYVPPEITLTLDNSAINRGSSTVLRWTTTGDADDMNITPGIGKTNISSFSNVSPSQTTTYTAYASGLGGSDSEEITLTVYQPPSVSINGPVSIDYNKSITLSYSGENVFTSLIIYSLYTDVLDNIYAGEPIILETGESVNDTITVNVPWNSFGPQYVEYTIIAEGSGNLTASDTIIIPVNIDQLPDAIDIPQSEDKIKDEQPVIVPDIEVTTEQILINDIDIPVEIKAEYPIQVEIDNDGNWRNIREI